MSYGSNYKDHEKEDYKVPGKEDFKCKKEQYVIEKPKKEDECGKIDIKAENVYIYVNCDECKVEKEED